MQTSKFIAALGAIYPAGRLLTRPPELIPYESDALTAYRRRPLAVVLPENQDEVINTVRLCHLHRVPFVARGSGTSLSGGSLPVEGGIVIAMNRLNRIVRIDAVERIMVVEAGVVNLEVSKAAAPYGLYFAPDPSSQPICTIGGNLAFNAGGAHCLKYGMTSNHVLGIKAVLPDGEIVLIGGDSVENVGPDLVGIYVGSEGLFGVALEVTLRLLPKPEIFKTLLAAYPDIATAGTAVSQVVASGLLPGAIEIMDRLAIDAAEAAVNAGYPEGASAILIVELDGEANQVEHEFGILQDIIERSGAAAVRVAQDDQDRQRIWQGRKSAFSAVGRLTPDYLVQDGVVPRTSLGEVLGAIDHLGGKYGLRVANVFHAGDGNLHPLIFYDGRVPGMYEKAEELAGEILKLCIDHQGSITGEHGIGLEKRAYLPMMFSRDDILTFKRIRQAIDPLTLSNPGKFFPDEEILSGRYSGPDPQDRFIVG